MRKVQESGKFLQRCQLVMKKKKQEIKKKKVQKEI